MINVFSGPVQPTSLDDFYEKKRADGEEDVFDGVKSRKQQIGYLPDGRKMLDGNVVDQKLSVTQSASEIHKMHHPLPHHPSPQTNRRVASNATGSLNMRAANDLWRTTITHGVAQQWRERAEGNRLQRARIYFSDVVNQALKVTRRQPRHFVTAILILLNICLFFAFLRLVKIL